MFALAISATISPLPTDTDLSYFLTPSVPAYGRPSECSDPGLQVRTGSEAVAQLLIDGSADVSAADTDGWTPLHVAP